MEKNIVEAVYCAGVKYGTGKDWLNLFNKSLHSIPAEQSVVWQALICSRETWILKGYTFISHEAKRKQIGLNVRNSKQSLRSDLERVTNQKIGHQTYIQLLYHDYNIEEHLFRIRYDKLGNTFKQVIAINLDFRLISVPNSIKLH